MRSTDIDLDPTDADLAGIGVRNRLRVESGLPLLAVEVERARLIATRERAAFEREWQVRRSEFVAQWVGNKDGWLTNMGRYAIVRQQVLRERKTPVENP